MRPRIVAFIFARGGSKGVPGKNIRPLAGKPLIAHAIETARQSRWIERVIVSTDDRKIAETARQWGAETPFVRPSSLATDSAAEWDAWRHAIGEIGKEQPLDVFVSVPTTSPLRSSEDIDNCIERLLDTDSDIVITVSESHRNPFFNMVVLDAEQRADLVMSGSRHVSRRQAAPMTYDMTTVAYAARPAFILAADSIFTGKVRAVIIPPERAVDIDTELDFQIAEFLALREAARKPDPCTAKLPLRKAG